MDTSNTTVATKPDLSHYPEPLVFEPKHEHKQTIILLHGRGDSARNFSRFLLLADIPEFGPLQSAFPEAKFIFPNAPRRRIAAFSGGKMMQWSLDKPTEKEEIQIEGLHETSHYLHQMLRQEIAIVGPKNVVLGGISMGCASSLMSLLTWDSEPFAAVVGMCGRLPFGSMVQSIASGEADNTIPNSGSTTAPDEGDRAQGSKTDENDRKAISWLRQLINVPATGDPLPFKNVPVFMGHGAKDPKVAIRWGKEAAACLRALHIDVQWKEYEELGHWYNEEMLHDLVVFVKRSCDWH